MAEHWGIHVGVGLGNADSVFYFDVLYGVLYLELADMTQEDIIRMAREAGFSTHHEMIWIDTWEVNPYMQRFAALVAAAEREKSLQLWMLLDDVDTADDIAKTDEAIYRSLCRQAHAKRWSLLNGDEVDAAIRARGQA